MTGRTFPAFPPRRGAVRGRTWWGQAWTRAMEDTSLDQGRLARGRTYARTGRVGPVTVSPGRISAPVQGTDPEPYRAVVLVEQLTDPEWERFLDEVASRAGHIAALLDRDMPHDLVRAAADAGVRLLPSVGDLEPDCGCPDWGYPCKHAAALCYQVAWLLDSDPFVLLLMRGRGESQLIAELQRRNAPQVAAPVAGVPAREVFSATPGPLPALPSVADLLSDPAMPAIRDLPAGPGHPSIPDSPAAPWFVDAPPGVDAQRLRLLAADAAGRARDLLAAPTPDRSLIQRLLDPVHLLTEDQDTVRIAATWPEAYPRPDLALEVAAWRSGGVAGLEVLQTPWTPPPLEMARARAALAADEEQLPEVREWRNRLTVQGREVQIRYGRDGRWYPYRKRSGRWWPAGPACQDPVTALSDLLAD